jgi:hypothetical protein
VKPDHRSSAGKSVTPNPFAQHRFINATDSQLPPSLHSMTTHEPLIAGLSPARLDLLSRLIRKKGHLPAQAPARVTASPITRAQPIGSLPLSYAQERLWFIDQLEPDTPTYNIPGGVHLNGRLHIPALAQSLAELVGRHEVLRTDPRVTTSKLLDSNQYPQQFQWALACANSNCVR